MYLLDTNVISELVRPQPHPDCLGWLKEQPHTSCFLSSITVGEIQRGIEKQRKPRPRRAEKLEFWLEDLLASYGDRVLPFETKAARRWGSLCQTIGNASPDLQIAAIALTHGLTVVTRNVRHFQPTGVALVNPFD